MRNALKALINSYNTNNFTGISKYLSPDCAYASQWVIEEKRGNDWIEDFLISKSHAIAKSGQTVTAKAGTLSNSSAGRECAVIFQGDSDAPSCLIISM